MARAGSGVFATGNDSGEALIYRSTLRRLKDTGATSGIGNAIARLLVAEGANVVAAGRNVEQLTALEGELGNVIVGARTDVLIEDNV